MSYQKELLSFKQLLSMLTLSRWDITTVIIFAVAIGLLSLVVPIAAQGLVTIVSFGAIRQPLFILAIVVFVLLVFSGITRLLQEILVETIQQRIFATIALKVADRLPKIDMTNLENNYGTELLNKFFDVITLQKTTASLLLAISVFVLQSILGMMLLALYHPALLAFDVVFVSVLYLIIVLPFSHGVETALIESNAKYEVVGWLEEMARVPLLFHFQNNASFGFNRTDEFVVKYLKARQSHYQTIIKHMVGGYGLQALASTSLFLIGGLLVLKNQMTLGQLVAAEIITTSLGASAAKLSRYLEKIYDLRAAAEKVNFLLDLPTEKISDFSDPELSHIRAFSMPPFLSVKNLLLSGNSPQNCLINFNVQAGSSLAIVFSTEIGRNLLIDSLLGLHKAHTGEILYNNIPLNNYPLTELRKKISFIRNIECFDGTIFENITIGNPNAHIDDIMDLLNQFSLSEFITALPLGLKYRLIGTCRPFTDSQLMKLVFVREILSGSFLFAIDEAFDLFPLEEVVRILKIMKTQCNKQTLLITTRREDIANLADNRINL